MRTILKIFKFIKDSQFNLGIFGCSCEVGSNSCWGYGLEGDLFDAMILKKQIYVLGEVKVALTKMY